MTKRRTRTHARRNFFGWYAPERKKNRRRVPRVEHLESRALLASIHLTGGPGDDIVTINATGPDSGNYIFNGGAPVAFSNNTIFTFDGLGGADTLVINNPAADVFGPTGGIFFNGGGQPDDILLDAGGTASSGTYTVGVTPDSGKIVHQNFATGTVQLIDFNGLAPVTDSVSEANFVVNASGADNAISYTAGTVGFGRVTIDNFESVEFTSKTALTINGGGGSDTINLNNPNTPTGLTGSITVNGGDPTAGSDTLVYNSPLFSLVAVTPTGVGAGTISSTQAVFFTGIEHLSLVTQTAGGSTALAFGGTSGNDTFEYTPGDTPDSGTVTGFEAGAAGFAFTPVSFSGFGGTFGYVAFNEAANFGGIDNLIVDGTSGDDTFGFASFDPVYGDTSVRVNGHTPVFGPGMNWTLRGLEGDDTFNVDFDPVFSFGPPASLRIEGGDPSGSDVLNLIGANNSAEIITIAPSSGNIKEQTISGFPQLITVAGTELIKYTGTPTNGVVDDTLVLIPGFSGRSMRVDDTNLNIDRATSDTLPEIDFTNLNLFRVANIAGDFDATVVTGGLAATFFGTNRYEFGTSPSLTGTGVTLTVEGDGSANNYTITNPAGSAAADITAGPFGKVIRALDSGFSLIKLNTLGGDDTVTVNVNGASGSDLIPIPIEYDGGGGSDQLIVSGTPFTPVDEVIYSPGPVTGEGRLAYENAANARLMTIDYENLEPVTDLVPAAKQTVNGTNADNAINLTDGPIAGPVNFADFSSVAGLAFNGTATQASNTLRLTNGGIFDNGSAFFTTPVSTTQSFSTHFQFAFSGGTVPEADGITFMIQNDPRGNTALGFGGGGLGYATDDVGGGPGGLGIRNSVAVEFDTFNNLPPDQNNANHVAILTDGVLNDSPLANPGFSLQNAVTNAWVDYNAVTHLLSVFVSQSATKPAFPLITRAIDLSVAVGATGRVGFSGATGGNTSVQSIQNWQFGVQTAQVSVDDQETIAFANKANLTINGQAGSDTINLNNPTTPTGLASITVNGGDPTGGSDTVIVNGTTAFNGVAVTPIADDAMIIAGAGPTVSVSTVEHVVYNGRGGNDSVTVFATAANDTIVHTPGAANDEGMFQVNSLLPLSYQNLGTGGSVSVNGGGGTDMLIADGTDARDTFSVAATSGNVNLNTRVVITQTGVEQLQLRGLAGDDQINLSAGHPYQFVTTDGGPDSDDTLQINDVFARADAFVVSPSFAEGNGFVSVNNIFTSYTGIDHILLLSSVDVGDSLTVNDDLVDNTWNVFAGPIFGDRVQIDNRESVDYAGFRTVNLINGFGNDVFRVQPTYLVGFFDSFTVTGSPFYNDRLDIVGTVGNDTATVRSTGVTVSGILGNKTVTFGGTLDQLELDMDTGNDAVTVDVASSNVVSLPILYDGGDGLDTLTVNGTPATAVDEVIYTPGPSADRGNLRYENAANARLMNIEFQNLEPVVDLVSAATLSVNGTNADNAINYTAGSVVPVNITTTQSGGGGLNEFQRVSLPPGTNSGTFTLTFQGQTTTPIAFNATAAAVQAALEALSNVAVGDVAVTGASPIWTVQFLGTLANTNVDQMTGALILTTGLVSVDNFETITFANKANLTLNGLAGSDAINLNNPSTPTGLTGITVNGGDPTAGSDELIVNGVAGASDDFDYYATAEGGGLITNLPRPAITFTGTEHLNIVGQNSDFDILRIDGPTGPNTVEVSVGETADAGSITGFFRGPGAFTYTPVAYQGILGFISANQGNIGGSLYDLIVDGTEFDDTIREDNTGIFGPNFPSIVVSRAGVTHAPIFHLFGATTSVTLRGLEGDDTFIVGPRGGYPNPVIVEGGDPSGSDVLNFTGSGAGDVTVDFGAGAVDDTSFGPVFMRGVEVLNVNAAGQDVVVLGTAGDDVLDVSPTSINAGTLALTSTQPEIGSRPIVNFFNTTNSNSLNVNLGSGDDKLIVRYSSDGEIINANAAAGTVTSAAFVDVDFTGVDSLAVYGNEGNDFFNVTPGAIPVFVDGGDPIGSSPGDTINIANSGGAMVSFEPGPENDEGGFVIDGSERVSFDHIEAIAPIINSPCVLILGTNADDDITVIARDTSYIQPGDPIPAGLDGIRDFTVSINNGPEVLYLNVGGADPGPGVTVTGDLFIDALAGEDNIVVRAPAPNGNPWSMDVHVAGGPPSAAMSDQGDVLEVETPGTTSVIFSPTGPDSGTLLIDQLGTGAVGPGNTLITMGTFTNACASTRAQDGYNSSPGGVEKLVYDGEGGGDTLTINGTAGDDTTTVTPTLGTGSFRAALSPALDFSSTPNTTVNGGSGGFDLVQIQGTSGPDAVTSTASTITVNGAGTVTIGTNMSRADLFTYDGDDTITLTTFTTLPTQIFAGNGSDQVFGSTQPDLIYGGSGDDFLLGGGGNDIIYGEDGDDRFGDPLVRDPAANDPGNDQFFGGAGSDQFFWDPGDGDDVVEGGSGDSDQIFFSGNAGAEQFFLFADTTTPSRFHLFRVQAAIDINATDIEEVNLSTLGGTDTVTVGRSDPGTGSVLSDLSTTTVRTVDVSLGADGAADNVIFEGRPADDNLLASLSSAIVKVAGLSYDLRIDGTDPALDRLTINGNEGNDRIVAQTPAVETAIGITLNGGFGDDYLEANGNINGNEGNDILIGGAGNNAMDGGTGDDTFDGRGGTDAVGGGVGSSVGDTILVSGTSGADTMALTLDALGHLLATINGLTTTYTNFLGGPIATSGVEQILVQGLNGLDGLTVDSTSGAIPILVTYDGGTGNDSLILTGGTASSDTYTPGSAAGAGTSVIAFTSGSGGVQTVNFYNLEPVIDLVTATTLTVNGTNDSNAINYSGSTASIAGGGFVGLTPTNGLVRISATGAVLSGPVAVTGLVAGDTLQAVDFQPGTSTAFARGTLFGLATNGTTARVYTINSNAGVATQVGSSFTVTASTGFGLDFNPTNLLLRITDDSNDNISFNPITGTATNQTALTAGADVVGSAYDRNDENPTTPTTLFGIDSTADTLVRQGDVNGTPNGPATGIITTIGSLGVNTSAAVAFDIVGDSTAIASLTVAGVTGLYSINLATGAATLISPIATPILGLAAAPVGLVSVDGFETIQFANKTGLVINGLAGDDTINLNNPNTPTGLTTVTVNGGDPTGSDTLVVNSGPNNLVLEPTAQGAGTVNYFGGGLPSVSFKSIESLHLVDQGTQPFGIDGTTGTDQFEYIPGATPDTGLIVGTMNQTGIPFALVPTTFSNMSQGGVIVFNTFGQQGGVDSFVFNGTAANDNVSVINGGIFGGITLSDIVNGVLFANLNLNNMAAATVQTHDGDDSISVAGDVLVPLTINGGNPSGSDVLNFTGSATVANLITANFGASTVQEATSGVVSFTGVEVLNINVAGHALAVVGSASDDSMTVSVGDATSGQVKDGISLVRLGEEPTQVILPVLNYSNLNPATSLSVDLGGGQDRLAVAGSTFSQTFNINDSNLPVTFLGYAPTPANTVQIDDNNNFSIDGSVTYLNTEALQVSGLEGNDKFQIAPGQNPPTGAPESIPIFVDGGDPIGKTAGDTIYIFAPMTPVMPEPGPENDEGGFVIGGGERVSYDHIEAIIITANCALILGTNADDDITVIARDQTYIVPPNPVPPTLNGVQDFTTVVNDQTEILWIDTPSLHIDALAGDDDVVVRAPAPNNMPWDVNVEAAGGSPSASTGDQGDVFELETPFQQTVTFTPTGSDSGVIEVTKLGGGHIATITLGSFVDACPPINYDSSIGGFELFMYDGEANQVPLPGVNGADQFTIIGTAGDDTIVHTPGAGNDEGTLRVNNLLGVTYQNLGTAVNGASLTVSGLGGADTLVANGTIADDTFSVANAAAASPGAVTLNSRLAINETGVEALVLNGQAGNDVFNVPGTNFYATGITLSGGENSLHSDVANLTTTAVAETVTTDVTAGTVTGLGGVVSLNGVEVLNLLTGGSAVADNFEINNLGGASGLEAINLTANAGAADTLSITGSSGPDTINVTPTEVTAGIVQANGVGPVVNFSSLGTGATTGAFTVAGGGNTDTVIVNGSAVNNNIVVTRGASNTVAVDAFKVVTVTSATTEVLTIDAGNGDDTINISGTAGNGQSINVQGGDPTASDLLTITMTTAGTTTVLPGATPDAGVVISPDGSTTFSGIELITVTGAAAGANILVMQGTNGNDTIALQHLGATDRAWVNNRAVVTFANYATVNLNGQFGDDNFSISPVGLIGVTTINIDGGDPTASDTVIVNGTKGADMVGIDTLTLDGARVTGLGPVITLTTTEHLTYSGQGGDDGLTVQTPAGSQLITVTPGALAGDGSIALRNFGAPSGNGNPLLSIDFTDISSTGSLSFVDAGGAHVDDLTIYGTAESNIFGIASTGVVTLATQTAGGSNLTRLIPVSTPGVGSLELLGLDGDDTFNVTGPATGLQFNTLLDGGNPSASDVVNLTGNGTTAVAAQIGNADGTATVIGGGLGTVTLTGDEIANMWDPLESTCRHASLSIL